MDTVYIAIVVLRNVPSAFAGLGEEPFPDVIMNGLLGYPGALDEISNLQR
jgi:hypothetical protein